ncbi:TPA: hypothetical protein ACNVDX_002166 [Citrobacter gillenii]
MKKILFPGLLLCSSCAFAGNIPFSIENVIAAYDTRTHGLEDGELTIRYGRPEVTMDMAESMFEGICGDYFMHKWKPETIKKITLLNITSDQGYKINAGGVECKKTGPMHSDQSRAFRASFIEPI